MARKPKIEFEGASYHVITRGDQRRGVFRKKVDFSKYLDLLAKYKK
jgi:REP element-mobilizing transposase RayT